MRICPEKLTVLNAFNVSKHTKRKISATISALAKCGHRWLTYCLKSLRNWFGNFYTLQSRIIPHFLTYLQGCSQLKEMIYLDKIYILIFLFTSLLKRHPPNALINILTDSSDNKVAVHVL